MRPGGPRAGLVGRSDAEALAGRMRSVFFTGVWLYGALALLLVGMASGKRSLTLFAILVLVTAGLARAWNRVVLSRVAYARSLSAERVFPGDVVTLTLRLVNRKALPLPWLTVEDELSSTLQALDRETTRSGEIGKQTLRLFTGVRPFERVSWRATFRCTARGVHTIGPVTLRSGDLFGFFTTRLRLPDEATILVYPRIVPLADLGFPPRHPFGETRVARQLLTDPMRVVGVRDYRAEDPFRAIHWKATARQGRLQVRVYEPTAVLQLGVFVNLDTFEHYWEGLDVELTEEAIVVAASIATWAVDRRYAVGVYANGVVHGSDQALRVSPGRGPAQLTRIMDGLAKLTPYSTLNFTRTLRAEATRFPWGSTFAIVTSQLPDPLTALLAELIAGGHRVVLVPLGDCPVPALRGLVVRRADAPSPRPAAAGAAEQPTAALPGARP